MVTSLPKPQGQTQANVEAGINVDRFATLFSPATPRSSPTLVPVDPNQGPMSYSRPRSYYHDRRDASGSDSDFSSSFVSVSATDDPLSTLGFVLPPSTEISSSSTDANDGDHFRKNSTLRFFGKFAQEAKEAAERNKRGVLDELLLYEDDPLYRLKEQDQEVASRTDDAPWPLSEPPESEAENLIPEQSRDGLEVLTDASTSLLDLDHNFFASKPVHNSVPPVLSDDHTAVSMPRQSPTRSPTQLARSTLAPPVASTSTASSTPAGEINDPLSHKSTPEAHHTAQRSNSYQTLSGLSSRWMSSLLSAKSNTVDVSSGPSSSTSRHPSLETLFNVESSSTESSNPRPRSIEPHLHSVRHAHTLPSTSDMRISHGTPFGHHSRTSPFASHVYTPPSGAPGYVGERYDWDKGFSADLRLEMEQEKEQESGAEQRGGHGREMIDVRPNESGSESGRENGHGHGKEVTRGNELSEEPAYVGGVAEFMDKKSGHVQLEGRKAITAAVLDIYLADKIRTHLPALARLPRKWTLLYSLDQHGISLNTLYTQCEFPPPRLGVPSPKGALLVVKDAGDALFGLWMGEEGVHPSRGKGYYGSGESFMWKYVDGKFEVFKWTGRNDYVALCEPEYISFGGGDGQYGLYLDESLLDGSSAHCLTFGNDPLCTLGPKKAGAIKFECVGLEVWSIGP